jgi:hypothetical protein
MIDSDEDKAEVLPLTAALQGQEELPYRIELWSMRGDELERVLALAASAALARAIFLAAQSEYLGRRLELRRGRKVIAESGASG